MTTPTLREAAQEALEALECVDNDEHGSTSFPATVYSAITALRAALAQPVPDATDETHPLYVAGWKAGYKHGAWMDKNAAAHPQPAPLTDAQIMAACSPLGWAQLSPMEVARAIEAAHGIK